MIHFMLWYMIWRDVLCYDTLHMIWLNVTWYIVRYDIWYDVTCYVMIHCIWYDITWRDTFYVMIYNMMWRDYIYFRFSLGDTKVPFSLQSIVKPLSYALVLNDLTPEVVHKHVGQEPSGKSFNELTLDYERKLIKFKQQQ